MREAGLRRELAAQATEMTRLREALRECEGRSPGEAGKGMQRGVCRPFTFISPLQ